MSKIVNVFRSIGGLFTATFRDVRRYREMRKM